MRLVANMVRGKSVNTAIDTLTHLNKKAKNPLLDLFKSAVSNAKHNFNIEKDKLVVKEIRVDSGFILKRRMPRARGTAYPINKRTSHVKLVLEAAQEKAQVKAKENNKK